jgi:hypothetical protein
VEVVQVYRFKVALKHHKRLWRRIETKGSQKLGDLDKAIRGAFKHDEWDHLSAFFRGRAWRSEVLAEISPFERGGGARKRIDRLGLSEGDALEYVYDFGEDIQHVVTLEKVVELDEAAEYPRIVSQNKPRYQYCTVCEAHGRKVVATWICIDCSNEEGRDVLLCDDCASKEDEDHYIEEMLY